MSDRINNKIPELCNNATVAMNNALALHDRLSSYWSGAYRTFQISAEPNMYIQFAPKAIQLVQPRSTADGFLTAGADIECTFSLFVGNRPSDPMPAPLPAPAIVPVVEPKFHVFLPISMSLDEITAVLENALRGKQFVVNSEIGMEFNQIVIGSTGSKLLVRVTIEAFDSMLKSRLEGQVTLEGIPVVTGDGLTLGLDQLDYTVESKNELLNLAAWLVKPVVLAKLKSVLIVGLDGQLTAANNAANHELEEKFKATNFQPAIKIDSINASDILILRDKLIIAFSANGSCQLGINL